MKFKLLAACLIFVLLGCNKNNQPYHTEQNINVVLSGKIEIPIKIEHHMPVVECIINDKKARMILDTAASVVCIFEDKIDKFGIKVVGRRDTSGYTAEGFKKRRGRVGDKIKILFEDKIIIDIEYLSILPKHPHDVDGIISAPLLSILNGIIDFTNKRLVLGKSK